MIEAAIGAFVGMVFATVFISSLCAVIVKLTTLTRQIERLLKLHSNLAEDVRKLELTAIAYAPPDIAKKIQ